MPKEIIKQTDSTNDDLLAIYLIYNVDFKELIKDLIKISRKSLVPMKNILCVT